MPVRTLALPWLPLLWICLASSGGQPPSSATLDVAGIAPERGSPPIPAITLSIDRGTAGTPLMVIGSGFPANEIVAVYIDQPGPYLGQPGPVTDAQGNFRLTVVMPGNNYDPSGQVDPSKPGPHQICGDTTYPGSTYPVKVRACAVFTVERGQSPTPTPLPSPAGSASPRLPVPAVVAAFAVLAALVIGIVFLTRKSP